MKRKFKIIALSVSGGINNKMYESGEVVNEDGFHSESIDKLIEGAFIKEVTENSKDESGAEGGKAKKK